MKLPFKIVLINFGIATLFSVVLSLDSSDFRGFLEMFGSIAFFGGLVVLIIGVFLLAMDDKRYPQGFLLSGLLLMLVGFITCSNVVSISVH
jgi:hypothetical protein